MIFAQVVMSTHMLLTWGVRLWLEVWGPRKSHGGHRQGVDLHGGLYRGGVLRRRSEVYLIIKMVLEFLSEITAELNMEH